MSLNAKNAHPRDALIEFDAGPHKYTCAGEGNYRSVTTWLHTHFQAFNADAIIKKMRLDKPTCKYYGQTPEEIKAGWDKNRDEAAAAGTAMHAAIEAFWLGGNPPGPPTNKVADALSGCAINELNHASASPTNRGADALSEINTASALCVRPSPAGGSGGAVPPQFTAFVRAHPQLKPYRTEWMIFDEDVRLAGSIDFVTENPDGTLTIYDWKRCKEIKKTNSFGDFAITDCIAHLPDTNYWHYALQLNTYKTILERKYAKKVTALFLVGLHPNLPNYQLLKVPDLRQEMADLFELRRAQL